jgi:outer membrane lipoprotein SlyB
MKIKNIILFTLLSFTLASCASRPKLYPNDTLKAKGKEASEADIDQCLKDADTYLDSSEGKKIAKSAGFGAAVGGAMGAVAGAFYGDIGGGAARGAAIGGTGGAVSGSLTPDQLKHRYVNQCLADKGYNVIGWN